MTDHRQRTQPDTTTISIEQLAKIGELLTIVDEFLRSGPIAQQLAEYLHTTGQDRPDHPHRYDVGLLIDQISFTAHALRTGRHQPPDSLPNSRSNRNPPPRHWLPNSRSNDSRGSVKNSV